MVGLSTFLKIVAPEKRKDLVTPSPGAPQVRIIFSPHKILSSCTFYRHNLKYKVTRLLLPNSKYKVQYYVHSHTSPP